MNDSTERLLAKLAQATSSETTEPMDEETAMLRESWLAFGKLIDAADAESKRSIAQVRPTRHARLIIRFIAALAASMLVAFATWAILNRGRDSVEPSPSLAVPNQTAAALQGVTDVAELPSATNEQIEALHEFAWEDSFDEQLASTSQAIRSAQADWNGGDRRYSLLLDQFEQFSEELGEGSL